MILRFWKLFVVLNRYRYQFCFSEGETLTVHCTIRWCATSEEGWLHHTELCLPCTLAPISRHSEWWEIYGNLPRSSKPWARLRWLWSTATLILWLFLCCRTYLQRCLDISCEAWAGMLHLSIIIASSDGPSGTLEDSESAETCVWKHLTCLLNMFHKDRQWLSLETFQFFHCTSTCSSATPRASACSYCHCCHLSKLQLLANHGTH